MKNSRIATIRRKNLQQLTNDKYGGDRSLLANALGMSISTINSLFSEKKGRLKSDKQIKKIESRLRLNSGYLDVLHRDSCHIHYISIKVKANYISSIVERLYVFSEIQECSAVLGEFDIILKIIVSTPHKLARLLSKIATYPGVLYTKTNSSIGSIRWQRNQEEHNTIETDTLHEESYFERYSKECIDIYFKNIRKLEKNDIKFLNTSISPINIEAMLASTKSEIKAIVLIADQSILSNIFEYLSIQTSYTHNNNHQLLIIENNSINNIKIIQNKFKETGCKVSFISKKTWKEESIINKIYETFILIDKTILFKKIKGESEYLVKDLNHINDYSIFFNKILSNSATFDEVINRITLCKKTLSQSF